LPRASISATVGMKDGLEIPEKRTTLKWYNGPLSKN
jgi:hypothetical protein